MKTNLQKMFKNTTPNKYKHCTIYWENIDNQTWINSHVYYLNIYDEQLLKITPKINIADYIQFKTISSLTIGPINRFEKQIDGDFYIDLKPEEVCYVSINKDLHQLEFEIISLNNKEYRKNKGTIILELKNVRILLHKDYFCM